jgi:hypothetical protein
MGDTKEPDEMTTESIAGGGRDPEVLMYAGAMNPLETLLTIISGGIETVRGIEIATTIVINIAEKIGR